MPRSSTALSLCIALAALVRPAHAFATAGPRYRLRSRVVSPAFGRSSSSSSRSSNIVALADGNEDVTRSLKESQDVWEFREEFARGFFGTLVNWKEEEREEELEREEKRAAGESAGQSASKSAFVASAAAVVIGALVIRLGGRAALVSVLGLDIVAELGIGDQIDQILAYANQAGGLTVVIFLAAWIVAKVFLIDVISIALAFSSGVLFGGVLEGAFVSAIGATLGSLTAFGLSRTLLQDKVSDQLEKQPVARALAKVVEQDGFKTVFVLRLSPILPIPLGTYPYIYGTSKLNPLIFSAATFLGSLKPYLLDSYLGLFAKQIIDGDSLDESRDLILLVGLGALVLVGVFATELANESWDLVQQEVRAEEKAKKEAKLLGIDAEGGAGDAEEEASEPLLLGPFNVTDAQAKAVELIPLGAREEAALVWESMRTYLDGQWEPAARFALAERQRREAKRLKAELSYEKALNATKTGDDGEEPNIIERVLAALATPAEEDGAGGADAMIGDPKARTAEEKAARSRRAEWSLEGPQPWRQVLESLVYSFALMGALRKRWVEYDSEEVTALLTSATTTTTTTTTSIGPPPSAPAEAQPERAIAEALVMQAEAVVKEAEAAGSAAEDEGSIANNGQGARRAEIDSAAVEARQRAITARLAEIDAALGALDEEP